MKRAKRMQRWFSVKALKGLVRKPAVPASSAAMKSAVTLGALAGSVRQELDILSPIENEWEASKD